VTMTKQREIIAAYLADIDALSVAIEAFDKKWSPYRGELELSAESEKRIGAAETRFHEAVEKLNQ
jgi:hypothetical protein